jgi:hypothetical protein
MHALGFAGQEDFFQHQDLQEYAKLFSQPLPKYHICALAALFGWTVPEQDSGIGIEMQGCS